MEWFEPEKSWDLFGINSRDEFVKEYVVEGRFHERVPEDITKSFITVSYLLAHSYYHFPMFDEAMSKMLLIMEMAIKLKAETLNIPLKKGKRDKRLAEIINEVFENKEMVFLKPDFDRAREFRNMKMHPKKHQFMGVMGFTNDNARLFVNIINLLFLDTKDLEKIISKTDQLHNDLKPFQNGLHVLQFQGQKILIDGFHTFKYREFENNKMLLIYVNPIIKSVHEQFLKRKYPEPLIIAFSEFIIKEDSIEGLDLERNAMKIYIDNKEQNLKTYYDYIMALSDISETDIQIFVELNSSSALWKMEKIVYENFWFKVMNDC